MRLRPLGVLLPIGAGGLIAGLPVFFILCDYLLIEKTKLVTGSFIAIWILCGAVGGIGRRTAILQRPLVCLSFLGFLSLYYINWAIWPKGTELDEFMWAYSVAHAMVPFLFGSLFERRDLGIFFIVVTCWGLFLAGLVLDNYLSIVETGVGVARFTVVEWLNPVTQSLIIGFAVLVLYAQVLVKCRYYFLGVIGILMFAMLLGGSRGPAIALLVGLGTMTFFAGRLSRRTLIILMLVVSLRGVMTNLPDAVLERYFSGDRWLETQTGEGVPLRIERAIVALERWWEYPVFGSGTSGNRQIYYSHNLFIQILMETGLIGLALFLSMLIPLILYFSKGLRASEVDWRTSAFMGFLVYSLLEAQVSGTYMYLNFVWVSMGILVAWPRIIGGQLPSSFLQVSRLPAPQPLRV